MTMRKDRRCTWLLLATLVTPCASANAQSSSVTLPETPLGHLASDWIQLCQHANRNQVAQWLTAHLSADGMRGASVPYRTAIQIEECTGNGAMQVARVRESTTQRMQVELVGAKSGSWVLLDLEANDVGQLDHVSASPTVPPESAMPRDLSDSALGKDVRALVARIGAAGLFSGIVTVARDTHVIVQATTGYANHSRQTPITGSTQFTLGSLGKMFTAASIGQLVDQGKISFGDPVGKFFPDYPNALVRDQVTVGMLLSHTGGLGDFLARRTPEMMKNGVARAAEFLPLYDHDAPLFTPGTQWAYSNAGLALAGAIVEKVSGEDYPAYIRQNIFARARMAHSDPNNQPRAWSDLVTPYTKFTPQGPSADWTEAAADIGSPAGGAISTADDLVRFAAALRHGTLETSATFAEMIKPRHVVPDRGQYGYAMEITDVYGRTVVGHGGGFSGVSTHLYLVLGSPYTIVVLANQDPPADGYGGLMTLALVAEKAKRGQ